METFIPLWFWGVVLAVSFLVILFFQVRSEMRNYYGGYTPVKKPGETQGKPPQGSGVPVHFNYLKKEKSDGNV